MMLAGVPLRLQKATVRMDMHDISASRRFDCLNSSHTNIQTARTTARDQFQKQCLVEPVEPRKPGNCWRKL